MLVVVLLHSACVQLFQLQILEDRWLVHGVVSPALAATVLDGCHHPLCVGTVFTAGDFDYWNGKKNWYPVLIHKFASGILVVVALDANECTPGTGIAFVPTVSIF